VSQAYILVVDDEPDIRSLVQEILEDEGYQVSSAEHAEAARAALEERRPDLALLDIWMPGEDGISLLKHWRESGQLDFPVVMISGHGTVETAVEATRMGAVDFVEKPLSLAKLLLVVEKALRAPLPGSTGAGAASGGEPPPPPPELVGGSAYIKSLREQAARSAENDATVLISGEPGSGKSVLARQIHALSAQRDGPFVALRGDSLTDNNAASELFGSEYAGVVNPGLFDQARGGTLFISDVGGLPEQAQTLLLAALEARQYSRVGGQQSLPLELRLIAASRDKLRDRVAAGQFREDLYYRIDVVPLATRGLREHKEDIPALLEYHANWFVEHEKLPYRHFNVAAQNRLRNHDWPGNIRELKNLVQRLMILGSGVEVGVDEVEQALSSGEGAISASASGGLMPVPLELPLRQARAEFERCYLLAQLKAVDGSIVELAKRVGMERTHLYRKLRSLGVDVGRARG